MSQLTAAKDQSGTECSGLGEFPSPSWRNYLFVRNFQLHACRQTRWTTPIELTTQSDGGPFDQFRLHIMPLLSLTLRYTSCVVRHYFLQLTRFDRSRIGSHWLCLVLTSGLWYWSMATRLHWWIRFCWHGGENVRMSKRLISCTRRSVLTLCQLHPVRGILSY